MLSPEYQGAAKLFSRAIRLAEQATRANGGQSQLLLKAADYAKRAHEAICDRQDINSPEIRRDRGIYGMRAVEYFIEGGDLVRAEELAVKMLADDYTPKVFRRRIAREILPQIPGAIVESKVEFRDLFYPSRSW